MSKQIPIHNNGFATVDDADYEALSQHTWYLNPSGYVITVKARKAILMHRMIMDAPKGIEVDHRDRNKTNNCRDNLRLATRQENTRYRCRQQNLNSVSQYKGVCQDKSRPNRWRVSFRVNGRGIYMGVFLTEIEAAEAYDDAAHKHYGDFAYLNFPERYAKC